MPLVINHSLGLSAEQQHRIADALTHLLEDEGLPADATCVTFRPTTASGATHEDPLSDLPPLISPEFRTRARRTRAELQALRDRLIETLQEHQTLSSLQARKCLGLTHCDWAPAAIRRMFRELEHQGLVVQQGVKRGTCYAWIGPKTA
nr:hypothetical protein [uncultured Holophaga sp.]